MAAIGKEFERWVFPRIHGCQIFRTREYKVGIVAANCNVMEGDGIFILQGELAPFVLRKVEGVDMYRLMGPCYVMDWIVSGGIRGTNLLNRRYEKVVLV